MTRAGVRPRRGTLAQGRERVVIGGVGLLTFVLYAAASVARFNRMQAGVDLAIFTEAVKRYSQGQLPWSFMKAAGGFNLLGDHFSPAVAVVAPVYRLFPDARTLLVVQAAFIALAAAMLTRTAVGVVGPGSATCVGPAYALAWGTQGMALFDFHEVALALPLLAAVCHHLIRNENGRAVAYALPLMMVKEDSVFLLLGVVMVLLARRRWKLAAWLTAYALVTFSLIVGVVIPRIGYYGRYTYWTASAARGGGAGVVDALVSSVASGKALLLLGALLIPSLGLALRSPLALVAVPSLLARLTSANETYWGVRFHYNATITLVLAFALVDALNRCEWRPARTTRVAAGAVAVALGLTWVMPLGDVIRTFGTPCRACAQTRLALATVPSGVSVAADDTLVAYLVDRTSVHELKPDIRDTTGARVFPRYIAMDRRLDGIWGQPQRIDGWREELMRKHAYGTVYDFVCERVLAGSRGVVYDVAILKTPYASSPR